MYATVQNCFKMVQYGHIITFSHEIYLIGPMDLGEVVKIYSYIILLTRNKQCGVHCAYRSIINFSKGPLNDICTKYDYSVVDIFSIIQNVIAKIVKPISDTVTYLCNHLKPSVMDHQGIIPVKFVKQHMNSFSKEDVYVNMMMDVS